MIGPKSDEREFNIVPFVRANNGGDGAVNASGRKNQPYLRYYSHSEGASVYVERKKSNKNGFLASSPMLMVSRNTHNDDEDDFGSSVNVQARYRIGSPALSGRASEQLLSTSPFAWSVSSSVHGDINQHRFVQGGTDCSSAIPVKSESTVCPVGSMGMRPFSANFGSASFSLPPALACSAPRQQNEQVLSSSHLDSHAVTHSLGTPPPPPLMAAAADYKSPLSFSFSQSYHSDVFSLRSPTGVSGGRCGGRMPICGNDKLLQVKRGKSNGGTSDAVSSSPEFVTESACELLPLCSNDDSCTAINDREHQEKYIHTCRLFPCYHGQIAHHAKLFRHAPGQIMQPEVLVGNNGTFKKLSAEALTSVNFNSISPDAPNAFCIIVKNEDKSYVIHGDWLVVRVHTFKRYLHQVFKIPPTSQVLVLEEGAVLSDDIRCVGDYGVVAYSVIMVKRKEESDPLSAAINNK